MKRLTLLCALLLMAGLATAETFTYTPDPEDLYDFPHAKYITWGIDVSDVVGMQVVEVELYIDGISNWDNGDNVLYIHMMDNQPLGVTRHRDNSNPSDAFEGQGELIDAWVDYNGEGTTDDISYMASSLSIVTTSDDWCQDGVLGFGFDPDCHYWNSGVRVVIIAEPMTATQDTSWSGLKELY